MLPSSFQELGICFSRYKDDWDLMVAAKGNILSSFASVTRQFPVVVEGHADWEVPLLFTSSHMKCCGGSSNEAQRQAEADEYMAFLRDAINGEGEISIAANTPVVYGGDLNMVGLDNPIYTLVSGDISNESAHGPDFAPDWDGSSLTEWPLLQSDDPFDFTWQSGNLSSEWMPGKLDYLITSDASADVKGGFVLRTANMASERLAELGLQAGDALAASDHFIVVGDLGLEPVEPVLPLGLPGRRDHLHHPVDRLFHQSPSGLRWIRLVADRSCFRLLLP